MKGQLEALSKFLAKSGEKIEPAALKALEAGKAGMGAVQEAPLAAGIGAGAGAAGGAGLAAAMGDDEEDEEARLLRMLLMSEE